MLKFGRNYILTIQATGGGEIVIKPPFTIEFDIKRDTLSSLNVASIRIYNLSEKTRSQIRKNQYDFGLYKKIRLDAGYGNNLSTIMIGNVTKASSVREGVNFVTSIECYDGGFAFNNAFTSQQYPSGTANTSVVANLVDSLKPYGVDRGVIGELEGSTGRGNSYSGATCNILKELTGGAFFIDNQRANILGDNEYIEGDVTVINSSTGLLGTPKREEAYLIFDMLFEPKLAVGRKIKLKSSTEKNYNGEYKVISIHHKGMISESVGGSVITSVGLFFGTKLLKGVAL